MQRAAAKQLTRLAACPLHRHYAFFMSSAEHSFSVRHHQLLHFHRLHQNLQKLAIACTPSPLTLLRSCIHLSMLIRCFSNGSPLPSHLVQDSDGLPSTHQSIRDRNNAYANDDCISEEAVDRYTSQSLPGNAHLNQEEKTAVKGGLLATSALSSSELKSQVDPHRLRADPHCTQSSLDYKGDEVLPSSEVSVQLQGNGFKDDAILGGRSSLKTGVPHDLTKAGSPSVTFSPARKDGGVKVSVITVLNCQSPLEEAVCADSSGACVNHSSEVKFDNTSDLLALDALSAVSILDKFGWGEDTKSILQRSIGTITPELVASVVDLQKNAKVAFCFLEWAGNHDKFLHREETFTKVVGRLGKESDFELGWKVLEYMKRHGLKVDYAFSILIHRLRSANMVDEVIKAMESMVSFEVIPTIPLFTVALQLIVKANKFEEVHTLYRQMRQASLQPDTKMFGILISGFGRAGQVDDALSFFKEMQRDEVSPDSFIYTSLIRSFAAAGKYAEGQIFYTEMVQNKCLPKVLSRPDLECALYDTRSMEEIHRFLENLEIAGRTISVYTYNNILQHLVDNEMFLQAVQVLSRLSVEPENCDMQQSLDKRTARRNMDSYSILIAGLCKAAQLTEALRLFKDMLVNEFKPTSEMCNRLLHSLSSNEAYMFEAVELSRHMVRVKLTIDLETQKTFLKALHDAGDVAKARKIFESMKWRGCIDPASSFHALAGAAR